MSAIVIAGMTRNQILALARKRGAGATMSAAWKKALAPKKETR